ncbi:MAG TPA: 16S rRNA (cytosine(1402)-N(4))-methyltransferase RsmH [Longimicrobiales bacterium]|nr:16S rRNA (cytosine(1402)-N(4))-methyltransferase RsmH [Longimicrobiales bacterium]
MSEYHDPVMGSEVVTLLSPRGTGLYLDGTVGGGGHTRQILEACGECRVLAVDRDREALEHARVALAGFRGRVRFLHGRFDQASEDAEARDAGLDGALLDLGVSSRQLEAEARGFTFRRGAALDMRMDPSQAFDAESFLAEASEKRLAQVFHDFGEEPRAKRLAREIVKRRSTVTLRTSDDLVAALSVTLGRAPSAREKARIFQAVRIAVNEELEILERGLPAIREVMNGGAAIVVISYHSLEDRLVKNVFRDWSTACVCPPELPVCVCDGRPYGETLTRRPIRPSEGEVDQNPRARSAKLRAWRRAA